MVRWGGSGVKKEVGFLGKGGGFGEGSGFG